MNHPRFYDSNGVIKDYEKIIQTEKKILKTLDEHEEFYFKEKEKTPESKEFHFFYERILLIESNMQKHTIALEEDFVYVMKNMVALEKEVISMIDSIRNHPKLNADNKIWNEIIEKHLPRLRTYGDIMDKYAKKRQSTIKGEA